jgi:hypothetical protein
MHYQYLNPYYWLIHFFTADLIFFYRFFMFHLLLYQFLNLFVR